MNYADYRKYCINLRRDLEEWLKLTGKFSKKQYILGKQKYELLKNQLESKSFTQPLIIAENGLTRYFEQRFSGNQKQFQNSVKYLDLFVALKNILKAENLHEYKKVCQYYDNFYMENIFLQNQLVNQKINSDLSFRKWLSTTQEIKSNGNLQLNYIWTYHLFILQQTCNFKLCTQQLCFVKNQIQKQRSQKRIKELRSKIFSNLQLIKHSFSLQQIFSKVLLKNLCEILPKQFKELNLNSQRILQQLLFQKNERIGNHEVKYQIGIEWRNIWLQFQKFYNEKISQEQMRQILKTSKNNQILQGKMGTFDSIKQLFINKMFQKFSHWQIYYNKQIILEQTYLNHLYYETEFYFQSVQKQDNQIQNDRKQAIITKNKSNNNSLEDVQQTRVSQIKNFSLDIIFCSQLYQFIDIFIQLS